MFARQILEKEVEAYRSALSAPTFFERGVIDAVAFLASAGGLSETEADSLVAEYPYQAVFIFPPWEEIYCVDEERDHTFAHAEAVYHATSRFYRRCGYEPVEVPRASIEDRGRFILGQTGA